MDHGALEAVLGDGAFEFVRGRRRIAGRQRREGREPVRLLLDEVGKPIVDACGDRGRIRTSERLGRRRAMREHLYIDTSLVHFLETDLPGIKQPGGDVGITLYPLSASREFLVPVMLLQR